MANRKSKSEAVNPYNLAVVNSELQPVESSAYLTFEEVMAWNRANADKMPPLKNVEIKGKRNGGKM